MFFFRSKPKLLQRQTSQDFWLIHFLFCLCSLVPYCPMHSRSFSCLSDSIRFFWYRSYQSFHWTYQLQIPLVWYSAVCCKKLWNAVDGRCFANCLPCTEFRWTWQQHRLFRLMCIFAKSIHNHCVSVSPSRCSAFCKCVTMYTFLLPF